MAIYEFFKEANGYFSQIKDSLLVLYLNLHREISNNPQATNLFATNHPALGLYTIIGFWISKKFPNKKQENLEAKMEDIKF